LEESLVRATENTLRQAGAIVYRTIENEVRVLLVTSRDTGRWVIPKGHIDAGLTPAQAAAREAYEEAGIKGTIRASFPLGFFSYLKKLKSGGIQPTIVEVYLIRADRQLKKWPESGQRTMSWVPVTEAARLVDEPGLARLFRRLLEILGSRPNLDEPVPAIARRSK
jgi:8-oxo-dGTP pyrophosphatase MutT (NUDIX family)